MGTYYNFDRNFTNFVHDNLAINQIYRPIGWLPQTLNTKMTTNVDMNNGVDYFLIDTNSNRIVTVQERFREVKYKNYNDFTIRFEREYNPHEERRLSEYYKLNAYYFVYGIIDADKFNVSENSQFLKYAIIDLNILKEIMDEGLIVINRELKSLTCKIINGVINCPVNYNRDGSSSFFPIDIKMLADLFPNSGVIVCKKGF